LSPKGRAILTDARTVVQIVEDKAVNGADEADLKTTKAVLIKAMGNLK